MSIQRVVAIVLVSMVACSLSQGGARVADAALIAHWALDDGQTDPNTLTAIDSVSPAANGTWEQATGGGPIPRWVAGIAGGAAEFGGMGATGVNTIGPGTDDVITTSGDGKLDVTGALTIAAWIRFEDMGGRNSTRHIAGKDRAGGAAGDAYSIKHDMTSGADRIQFLIDAPSGGVVTGNVNLTSELTFAEYTAASQNNGWVHVAGVFEPGQFMRLYIDGVLADERTTDVPAAIDSAPTTPFNIGRLDNSTTHSFNGQIDDVQVYSHALTDGQIALLFNNPGLAIPEPSSAVLFLFGVLGLAWAAVRRR